MFRTVRWVSAVLFAASGVLFAQSKSAFFPVTPCRVVDTRGVAGTFSGPSIAAISSRSFPIPTGPCSIPFSASAYSFNVTVVPHGPLYYLTIWPTGSPQPLVSTLNSINGDTIANAAVVAAGVSGAVSVFATNDTDVIIDVTGYFSAFETVSTLDSTNFGLGSLANDVSSTGANTGIGALSLSANSSGYRNSAVGAAALQANTTGIDNTALGYIALAANVSGMDNTAVGSDALRINISGKENTAIGDIAMGNNTGSFNTAVGSGALYGGDGQDNTAVGYNALSGLISGTSNIGIGVGAGSAITDGSGNIDIANGGTANDSNVIRIGSLSTSAYIAGISGVPVTGSAVIINANGQLGVQASSMKYKEDILDLADDNDALMQLRPVSFRYKGNASIQYGLIAEEVEKVYPDLVARDKDGQPLSVQYHELPALLLKEIQMQRKTIEEQKRDIKEMRDRLAALEKLLAK